MAVGPVWDHQAAGSNPVTRTNEKMAVFARKRPFLLSSDQVSKELFTSVFINKGSLLVSIAKYYRRGRKLSIEAEKRRRVETLRLS